MPTDSSPAVAPAVAPPPCDTDLAAPCLHRRLSFQRVEVLGLPLARVDYTQTLELIEQLVAAGQPSYFITANLNYAMLSAEQRELSEVNRRAAFLVADGYPLVWLSRLKGSPLPQRVTGADLLGLLMQRAAEKRWRVFLFGGAEQVAEQTARHFLRQYPALQIAGIESPVLEDLSRAAPQLLLVALGQPKGELWLARHYRQLGVPVCVQLGASFDFVAGRARRAPHWIQQIGCEWLFRMMCQPRRLLPRYGKNAVFLLRSVWRELLRNDRNTPKDER